MQPHIDAGQLRAQGVGLAFRSTVNALRYGRIEAWSLAWQELANISDPIEADILLERMADFVKNVESSAARPVTVFPQGCPGLCRDECLAVSMVAAAQEGACPALRACAFALLSCSQIDRTVASLTSMAETLAQTGAIIAPRFICNAAALLPHSYALWRN